MGNYKSRRTGRRAKVPEAFAHGGREGDDSKPKRIRGPVRFRRLRIVADNSAGYVAKIRDVYLESALCPLMADGSTLKEGRELVDGSPVTLELVNYGLPVELVGDIVRWAAKTGLTVMYDPPGNMDGYINPRVDGGEQQTLFD